MNEIPIIETSDIPIIFTAGIAFILLLATSFLVITFLNQRKKWQIENEMGKLKEQQQNQLIEAAVRSEEMERHRIAEMLHDEVGAILSSVRMHFANINSIILPVASSFTGPSAFTGISDLWRLFFFNMMASNVAILPG